MKLELEAFLNLALGCPEVGAVNFKILHGFLKEILKHLRISSKEIDVSEDADFTNIASLLKPLGVTSLEEENTDNIDKKFVEDLGKRRPSRSEKLGIIEEEQLPISGSIGKSHGVLLSSRVIENRLKHVEDRLIALDSFPNTDEILKWAKGREQSKQKMTDIWNFMNMQRRLDAVENDIGKLNSVVDSILQELRTVEELQRKITDLEDKFGKIEELNKQLEALSEKFDQAEEKRKLENLLKEFDDLKSAVNGLPTKDDVAVCVQWPQLDNALHAKRQRSQTQDSSSEFAPSTPVQILSLPHASPEVLKTLGDLGELTEAHRRLLEELARLKELLSTKANLEDLEGLSKGDVPEDLLEQLENLHNDINDLKLWREQMDSDTIAELKRVMETIKRDSERLQNTIKQLLDEESRKQKHIDTLYTKTNSLEQKKANIDDVSLQITMKADKTTLDNLVSRSKFDSSFGQLDEALKELLEKLSANEANFSKLLSGLSDDVEKKLDRAELKSLKDYIESRLKALRPKQREEQYMDEDPAAGFKKAMLSFNCLSCDRPVYFSPTGVVQSIPSYSGFPTTRSGRPYTTFELDQIRMLQKGNLKSDIDDYTVTTLRSCGGSHTLTSPVKRTSPKVNSYVVQDEEVIRVPTVRSEIDIQGQDGKLYKGRIDELPNLPKQASTQQIARVKPKSARSPVPPHQRSFSYRRPKTAMARTQTPDRPDRPQSSRPRTASPVTQEIFDTSVADNEPGISVETIELQT